VKEELRQKKKKKKKKKKEKKKKSRSAGGKVGESRSGDFYNFSDGGRGKENLCGKECAERRLEVQLRGSGAFLLLVLHQCNAYHYPKGGGENLGVRGLDRKKTDDTQLG